MQAKDIMTTKVTTVTPDTSIQDIAKLLAAGGFSAVPVVDAQQKIIGIVSEGDLLRRHELHTERRRSWWLNLFDTGQSRATDYVKAHGQHAEDVMTRDPIVIATDTPVQDIADLLEKRRIKRVPVVQDGKLVGIVSRANLIQALAMQEPSAVTTTADDRAIREQILQALHDDVGLATSALNVIVERGVVYLWGMVDTAAQRQAAEVATENVPGVKGVDNKLSVFSEIRYSGI